MVYNLAYFFYNCHITCEEVTISIERCFYLLKKAEQESEKLYTAISLNSSLRFPDLSGFFSILAEEEKTHARFFDMIHTYYQNADTLFFEEPDAERTLEEFLQFVEKQREFFLSHFERLTQLEIIDIARQIEDNLAEKHHFFAIRVLDEKMKKFLESLLLGDNDHLSKIENFSTRVSSQNQE